MGRGKKRRKRTGAGSVRTGENLGKSSVGAGPECTGADASSTGVEGIENAAEGLGVLSMNEVEIDEAALARAADAALASAPVDAAAVTEAPEQLPESWAPLIDSMTPMLRIAIFPQWDITEDEAKEFSASLGECLDQVFPGGLAGPYACWCRLIFCAGGIVAGRVIKHGNLPPLGPRRVEQSKQTPASASADATH
jgi:hypothetical protein